MLFSTPSAGFGASRGEAGRAHSLPGSFFLPSESWVGGGQGRGQHFQEGVEVSAAEPSVPSLAKGCHKEAEEATSWRARWVDLSGRSAELRSCRVRRKTGRRWILSSKVWGTCVLGLHVLPRLVCAQSHSRVRLLQTCFCQRLSRTRWEDGQEAAPLGQRAAVCTRDGLRAGRSDWKPERGSGILWLQFSCLTHSRVYDSYWKASKSTKINSSESWPAKPQAGDHSFSPEIRKVPKLLICKHVKSCPGFGDIFIVV